MPNNEEFVTATRERLGHANDNFIYNPTTRATKITDSPIDRMLADGRISAFQFEAAQRYQQDWYNAGMSTLGAMNLEREPVDGGGESGISDHKLDAKRRYFSANRALGDHFRGAVESICIFEQSVEAAGRKCGLKNAAQARAVGVDRLRGGLDVLARHYGIMGKEPNRSG